MAKEKKVNPLKVVTPKFRLSFPELFTAKAFGDQDESYSIKMLFPKKTDLKPLREKLAMAAREKWGDQTPKNLNTPWVDGNTKDLDGYEDMIVLSASSKFKPQVVGLDRNEILAPEDIYAGCYARAAIIAYAWEYTDPKTKKVMKRGVSFRLESVQKLEDGEPFVSRADAAETFDDGAYGDGVSDDSNYEDDDDIFG